MCPLRVILIFVSLLLALFVTMAALAQDPSDEEEERLAADAEKKSLWARCLEFATGRYLLRESRRLFPWMFRKKGEEEAEEAEKEQAECAGAEPQSEDAPLPLPSAPEAEAEVQPQAEAEEPAPLPTAPGGLSDSTPAVSCALSQRGRGAACAALVGAAVA